MRQLLIYLLLALISLPGCSKHSSASGTSRGVKPRYHHRWYDRKKDKHRPRVKAVNLKN